MIQPTRTDPSELPYPTCRLEVVGGVIEEYIIPEHKKKEVLKQLYPFKPVPSMNKELYDLHEEKKFFVRDFRVVRDGGFTLLVSPYYPISGGTVMDWVPLSFADDDLD